ncbi:hypothetical protein LOK49_LG15G02369 [Camellia lanceoleosa]|uniref:Uncharacterized protein n=1 Tax=Camellia lanceoleosa TaxID=1840588 RepID=A0ACC0F0H7_9ERIC|nr:hypothetical protein LOK49_LG15G02369 [Camellia lanceoleosa]
MTTTFTTSSLSPSKSSPLIASPPSLANAQYGDDRVNRHIFIDHFKYVDSTDNGTQNVGLQEQWLEAWWPSSDDEFAFVVEDDLELSPLYYKFLRETKVNMETNCNWIVVHAFSCTSWFPRPWKEFRLWYDTHKGKGIKPFLQGMVTTGWYKKMGEKIWTPWFIKFIHCRGYFNLYTNFSQERAFSISHRDAGVNYGNTAGPDSYLPDEDFNLLERAGPDSYLLDEDFNLLETQPLSKLKWYDFCFRQVLPDRVVRSFDELGSVLCSMQKLETIILVAMMVGTEKGKDLFSMDGGNFMYIVAKALEQKRVKIKGIDEMSFGVNINASNVNQTSLGDGKKMVFWSFEMGLDLVWKHLEELGLWIIDGDYLCSKVVCHQS